MKRDVKAAVIDKLLLALMVFVMFNDIFRIVTT